MDQVSLGSVICRSLKKTLQVGCKESEQQIDSNATRKSIHATSAAAMEKTNYRRRACQHMKPRSFAGEGDGKKAMRHEQRNDLKRVQMPSENMRLENTPDSWSRTATVGNENSKFIAEDLLRGALELQESIIVLQNLRGSPKLIVPTRMKPRGKYVTQSEDPSVHFTNSCRFEANGCQGSRNFVNAPSGNRGEELRNLIKNSLFRKNLLMGSNDDDGYCCSTLALSRNNRSIQAHSKLSRQESSVYSEAKQDYMKSPTLIAKLMGLEMVPSEMVPSETVRQVKEERKEKRLSFLKARPEAEMPTRRSQLMEQSSCVEKKAFQEIKGMLGHKVLREGSQDDDSITSSCNYDTAIPKRNTRSYPMDVETSQIVIMKPVTMPFCERKNLQNDIVENVLHEKNVPEAKTLSTNMKMISGLERIKSFPRTQVSERSKLSIPSFHKKEDKKKTDTRETMNINGIQKPFLNRRKTHEKNTTDVTMTSSQVRDASSMLTNLERTREIMNTDGIQKPCLSRRRAHEKNTTDVTITSSQARDASSMLTNLERTREIMNINGIQKPCLSRRRAHEKKNTTDVTITRSQARDTSSMLINLERKSSPAKDNPSSPKSVSHHSNNKSTGSRQHYSKISDKEKKTIPKLLSEHAISINTDHSDCKELDPSRDERLPNVIRSSKPLHPKGTKHKSNIPVEEKRRKELYRRCEVMPESQLSGPQHKSAQEESTHVGTSTVNLASEQGEDIRSFLIENLSFLIHAQELLPHNANHLSDCKGENQVETEIKGSGLIYDCCIELVECKVHRMNHMNHPSFLSYTWSPRPNCSIEDMVEEVIGGMQNLRSYAKTCGGVNQVDEIYLKLERDLQNDAAVGGWDFGWKDASPVEETDRVVYDVERILTAVLVREALVELLS